MDVSLHLLATVACSPSGKLKKQTLDTRHVLADQCNNKTSNLTLENKMLFRKAKAQRLVSNENRLSKYAFIEFVNKTNEELDNNKQSQLGWVKYNILSSFLRILSL